MSATDTATRIRFCVSCGRREGTADGEVSFRSDRATICEDCTESRKEREARFNRAYQRARTRAVSRLIEAHRDEFDALMGEELDKRRDAKGQLQDIEPEPLDRGAPLRHGQDRLAS